MRWAAMSAGCVFLCLARIAGAQEAATPQSEPVIKVTIHVDAGKAEGPLKPVWRFFGADEPNYATMKDGRKTSVDVVVPRQGVMLLVVEGARR
ncbi:MAG: hypothetical protein MT490_07160 [Sphingomonas sp.]|uniref:hypothetical protein n=1 Tax=Sphingomonas sp. TaxID=28214 RepID=UPI00227346D9|nr:hypothetical protein [Sphingomonas sp.]MCX8475563.1 hypothetical protein [Sphingomonas sp.]